MILIAFRFNNHNKFSVALMKDSGLPIGKAAAIAKLATSEVATRVSHQV